MATEYLILGKPLSMILYGTFPKWAKKRWENWYLGISLQDEGEKFYEWESSKQVQWLFKPTDGMKRQEGKRRLVQNEFRQNRWQTPKERGQLKHPSREFSNV